MDKYPPDPTQQKVLEIFNLIFFSIFLTEMIIKVIGLGPKVYVRDNYNIFDCIVGKPNISMIKVFSFSLLECGRHHSHILCGLFK